MNYRKWLKTHVCRTLTWLYTQMDEQTQTGRQTHTHKHTHTQLISFVSLYLFFVQFLLSIIITKWASKYFLFLKAMIPPYNQLNRFIYLLNSGTKSNRYVFIAFWKHIISIVNQQCIRLLNLIYTSAVSEVTSNITLKHEKEVGSHMPIGQKHIY